MTDALRAVLEKNNITPDVIDLKRKLQGFVPGTPTIFDEIRKEEKFYLQSQSDASESKRRKNPR